MARTTHTNLRHPAGAIAPPLLKRQMSSINISQESDIVQVLPHPKAGGDQNVPQPEACGGDDNIPQHQKATFEVAKLFMEAIIFRKTLWPMMSDEKYLMVDEAGQLAIEAQDYRWALASAPVVAPPVCQLPGGRSLKINLQTQEARSVYCFFGSLIRLMMILNPKNIHS